MKTRLTADERRERMFDLYSANLSALSPDFKDAFICPLCLRSFDRNALSSKLLSEEHIIPSGNLTTLTCKKCNNETGSAIDSHLLKRVQHEEEMTSSGGPVRAKIMIGRGEHNANIYLTEKDGKPHIVIHGLPKLSNPALLEQAVQEFQSGTKEFKMNFNLGYVHLRSQAALLRSAYLTMFRQFGYAYVLLKFTEPIRQQIREPLTESPILGGIVRLTDPIEQTTVTLLKTPEPLRCFFVMLKLSKKIDYNFGVAMPGVKQECTDLYERWNSKNGSDKFNFVIIPHVSEHLRNPKYVYMVHQIWHYYNET